MTSGRRRVERILFRNKNFDLARDTPFDVDRRIAHCAWMQDSPPRLHHEDLDAYQAAISFLALAAKLFDHFPRGYGSVADQLKRASLSIPLNLAEGYGKRGHVDRARFYDIARYADSRIMPTSCRFDQIVRCFCASPIAVQSMMSA